MSDEQGEALWSQYPVKAQWEYVPNIRELQVKTGATSMPMHLRELWAEGESEGEEFEVLRHLDGLVVEVVVRGQRYALELNPLICDLIDSLDTEGEQT